MTLFVFRDLYLPRHQFLFWAYYILCLIVLIFKHTTYYTTVSFWRDHWTRRVVEMYASTEIQDRKERSERDWKFIHQLIYKTEKKRMTDTVILKKRVPERVTVKERKHFFLVFVRTL